ncbi:ATPase [Leptolyngbya sp. NIES-2104]|nr:ATPase [Leptolyngbya sp. NIES-2104]
MDFGEARSLVQMSVQMTRMRDRIESYNRALAEVDSSKKDIDELEKTLADLTDRMLIGVAFKYGKDSREYEMAGGMRKSDRIRKSSTARIKATVEAKAAGEIQQSA